MSEADQSGLRYTRVMLKLSGEALLGEKEYGVDEMVLATYAREIKGVVDEGVEVAIVIGGYFGMKYLERALGI